MTILIHVIDHDTLGRPLANLVTRTFDEHGRNKSFATESQTFAILPELGRFKDGDRSIIKTPLLGDIHGNTRPLPALSTGDVVACADAVGWPGQDLGIDDVRLVGEPEILGNAATADDAVAVASSWIAERDAKHVWGAITLHDHETIAFEASAERANGQPDEALILAWGTADKITTHVIAHKGSFMFFAEGTCCEDIGLERPETPGLWMLTKAQVKIDIDWETQIADGWGLEGDLDQVSPEDAAVRFGFNNVEALRSEIRTVLDDYGDEAPEAEEVALSLECVPVHAPAS